MTGMTVNNVPPLQDAVSAPSSPSGGVKKKLIVTAAILCAVATVLCVLGLILAANSLNSLAEQLTPENYEQLINESNADMLKFALLGIGGLLNFVAFILALVALIGSKPKTLALIVFLCVLFIPGIATGIAASNYGSAVENVTNKSFEMMGADLDSALDDALDDSLDDAVSEALSQ